MTHVYCAHLQHLTNGSKIGAEFATKRNLFQKRAVNMYRRYPYDVMGKVRYTKASSWQQGSEGFQTP